MKWEGEMIAFGQGTLKSVLVALCAMTTSLAAEPAKKGDRVFSAPIELPAAVPVPTARPLTGSDIFPS